MGTTNFDAVEFNSVGPKTSSAVATNLGVNIVNLKPSNTLRIRAAMANPSRNAIVACIGPSTTGGQSTGAGTSQANNSWPMQLARMLQAQGIPSGANNFFGDKACWGQALTAANFMSGDSRVVLTGSAAPTSFATAGGAGFGMAATGTIAFTPPANVTKFDIYYRDAVGQNWTWAIDGGAATTVNGAANAGTPTKITVSAGASGIHALTLAWVAGNARFIGVVGYDDTSGRREISFLNWGVSGATSGQLIEDVDSVASRKKTWTFVAPDLCILDDLVINDWRQNVSIDTAQANLNAHIAQAKASGDVIVTMPLWDGGNAGNTAQQDAYAAMVLATGLAADVPVLDTRSAWVSYAAANGAGFYSDTVHPASVGYGVKAASLAELFRRLRGI
jgi:lysophospholipase L1-like esterase